MSDNLNKNHQENLICRLCHWPLYPPIQLDCCGQRVCGQCSNKIKNNELTCPSCPSPCTNVMLDRGFLREIEHLQITCPECGPSWIGLLKNLREHLIIHCTLTCRNCEEKFVYSIQLETHQRETCPHRTVPCALASFGCSNEVLHSEIGKHYVEAKHQLYLLEFIKWALPHFSNRTSNTTTQNSINEQHLHILTDYLQQIQSTSQEINPVNNICETLNSERQLIERKVMEIREELVKLDEAAANSTKTIENLNQMLADMSQLMTAIYSKPITGINQTDSKDTFTWKVKLAPLLSDNSLILHSGLFQCSQWGYGMEMSINLQTDGQSQNRYVSMAFAILRGEYDAILMWPFSFPVTICLVDLTGAQNHIIHSFKPDSRLAIFGRPSDSVNTPYRIPKFCPIEKLGSNGTVYVRDGDMYVKIHIDFTGAGIHPFQLKETLRDS